MRTPARSENAGTAAIDWSIGEFAILLAIVAPLRIDRMFWGYVGLTGAVTGVLCAVLFHYYFCLFRCDWTALLMGVPLFIWPLLFSASLYQWRKQRPVHYNGLRD